MAKVVRLWQDTMEHMVTVDAQLSSAFPSTASIIFRHTNFSLLVDNQLV